MYRLELRYLEYGPTWSQ